MSRRTSIASTVEGHTTKRRGRYLLSGAGYQLVSDGSVRSGGPGEAAGSLDLLVGSLVSCALNAFQEPDRIGGIDRHVEIFARVERVEGDDSLGTLIMECFIDGVDDAEAEQLVEEYRQRCRIYTALKDALVIRFIAHGV